MERIKASKAIAIATALGVGAAALAGCGAPRAEAPAQTEQPAETQEQGEALANQADLDSATENLNTAYAAVANFTPEIVGDATASDEQAEAIRDFLAAWQAAEAQLAVAQTDLEMTRADTEASSADIAVKQAAIDAAQTVVDAARAYNPLAHYNTAYQMDGQWLGDKAVSDPTFISQLIEAPDLSAGTVNEYWNWQTGQVDNLFADPNGGGDTYSIHPPEGVQTNPYADGGGDTYFAHTPREVQIRTYAYRPIEGGEWGQTDATGTVIDFGRVIIEEGIEAGVQTYIFDKPDMSPAEFAASIDTTPVFAAHDYGNTNSKGFADVWGEPSIDGLYVNATGGNMGGVYSGETNIGKITSAHNGNRPIDPIQFPDVEVDDLYFGGQAIYPSNIGKESAFTTYTFVFGIIGAQGAREGIIPNLNDSAVRKSLMQYYDNTNLKSISITSENTIAID